MSQIVSVQKENSASTFVPPKTSLAPQRSPQTDSTQTFVPRDTGLQMSTDWSVQASPEEGLTMEDIDKQLASSSSGFMDQLVSDAEEPPNTESVGVQPKLAIGQVGDPYEVEADQVADRVMKMPEPIEEQSSKNQGEVVQRQPVALSISRLVQRQQIQAQAVEQKWAEADGMGQEQINLAVQRKCSKCHEEEEQEKGIQRKEITPESGMLQAKANSSLESRLAANAGGGSALADDVRSFMEPRFGADFNSVRVHTDSQAVQMSQELGAQAFTYGNDIYYGQGKSPGNNDLTAHELTHTIQQMGAVQVQRQSNSNPILGTDMDDPLVGTEGNDTISGLKGNDLIEGKEGDDIIYGGKDRDYLKGGDGSDTLYGNREDDDLFGELGDDKLYGGKGNDRLQGGAGDDLLSGDIGSDTFVFHADQDAGNDVVVDFQIGKDVIQLEGFPLRNFGDLEPFLIGTDPVLIRFPGKNLSIQLNGINKDQLSAKDFRFSGGWDRGFNAAQAVVATENQNLFDQFCLNSNDCVNIMSGQSISGKSYILAIGQDPTPANGVDFLTDPLRNNLVTNCPINNRQATYSPALTNVLKKKLRVFNPNFKQPDSVADPILLLYGQENGQVSPNNPLQLIIDKINCNTYPIIQERCNENPKPLPPNTPQPTQESPFLNLTPNLINEINFLLEQVKLVNQQLGSINNYNINVPCPHTFEWKQEDDGNPYARLGVNTLGFKNPDTGNVNLGLQENANLGPKFPTISLGDNDQAPLLKDVVAIKIKIRAKKTLNPADEYVFGRVFTYLDVATKNKSQSFSVSINLLTFANAPAGNPLLGGEKGQDVQNAHPVVRPQLPGGSFNEQGPNSGGASLGATYHIDAKTLGFIPPSLNFVDNLDNENWTTLELPVQRIIEYVKNQFDQTPDLLCGAQYAGGIVVGIENFGRAEVIAEVKDRELIVSPDSPDPYCPPTNQNAAPNPTPQTP